MCREGERGGLERESGDGAEKVCRGGVRRGLEKGGRRRRCSKLKNRFFFFVIFLCNL